MSNNTLENIKKLREITGVGFKDCKNALEETSGDIEKSIEFLRKKGIAKATKKMSRTASEGLVLVKENSEGLALIEINSETDFVAKNKSFIDFCKELSDINLKVRGDLNKLKKSIMLNKSDVENNLINLISKIGEKITIRRSKYFDQTNGKIFFYVHSAIDNNIGKIISAVQLSQVKNSDIKDFGKKIAMHIAASNPIALDSKSINKEVIDKELEIIKAELINSGKKEDIIDKISKGKINKFISDNTLIDQAWIMDPEKKVKDILQSFDKDLKIIDFERFKVGEGV